ncbi:DUF5803 family protein [Methanoregula sp.]|uniref:DUF5803 family protein n=1 Tax=Methanoregula sp. TaxID=2052170 RepID=UPI0035644E70
MRTPNRDRRRFAIIALCAALIITLAIPSAGALNATYQVLPNGTSYTASVDLAGASKYMFADTGILGENVPITVTNVTLIAENGTPVNFNWTIMWSAPSVITFPKGNYTVTYIAPLHDNHLQGNYLSPYSVNVTMPGEYDVRNPLLAGISTGANVTRFQDNSTQVTWNKTMSFDLRFYDQNREELLYMFAEFMVILAVILLMPFLLMRKPPQN